MQSNKVSPWGPLPPGVESIGGILPRVMAEIVFRSLLREYLALTSPYQEKALEELRESLRRHLRALGYSPNRISQGIVIVDKRIFEVVGSPPE